ncbi:MAG: type II toxin-antitoxin system VapB family antitoxin [Gemmatimonadales bacterium]
MAISIKDPEADRLARALAKATGESLTEAIRHALAERLARHRAHVGRGLADQLRPIQERLARLPVLDPRSDDELLGYDERGLPT